MELFDLNMKVLSKSMSLRMNRHSAIAGNIANADTPGYRPKAVSFEDKLQAAVRSGKTSDVNRVTSSVEVVDDKVPRLDGNSVNKDKQLAAMTENSMVYQATAEFLKKRLAMLKSTIQ